MSYTKPTKSSSLKTRDDNWRSENPSQQKASESVLFAPSHPLLAARGSFESPYERRRPFVAASSELDESLDISSTSRYQQRLRASSCDGSLTAHISAGVVVFTKEGAAPVAASPSHVVLMSESGGSSDAAVLCCAFSPDGRYVAFGTTAHTVLVAHLHAETSCASVMSTEGGRSGPHTDWVTGVAFEADGETVISCSRDGTLRWWDYRRGTLLRSSAAGHVTGKTQPILTPTQLLSIATSMDATTAKKMTLTTTSDGAIVTWEGGIRTIRHAHHGGPIAAAGFGAFGEFGASCGFDGEWNGYRTNYALYDSHEALCTPAAKSKPVNDSRWAKRVKRADDEDDEEEKLREEADILRTELTRPIPQRCVARNITGAVTAVGGDDGSIVVLGRTTAAEKERDDDAEDFVHLATLVCCGGDQTTWRQQVAKNAISVTSLAFHPIHPNWLLSGSCDGLVRLWNVSQEEGCTTPAHVFSHHKSDVNCVAFSPDGLRLMSGSSDGTVHTWGTPSDVIGAGFLHAVSHESGCWITCVAFSKRRNVVDGADGGTEQILAATGARDGTACLWDATTGVLLWALPKCGGSRTSAIKQILFQSPEQKASSDHRSLIATTKYDSSVAALWDMDSQTKHVSFRYNSLGAGTEIFEAAEQQVDAAANDGQEDLPQDGQEESG